MGATISRLDGLQATSAIREQLGLLELPVVICSAGVRAEDRDQLLLVLARLLSNPDPVQTMSLETSSPAIVLPPTPPSDWPVIEGLDGGSLFEQLDGDSAYFRQILGLLVRDLKEALMRLPLEVTESNFEAACRRVHKLKGTAAMLFARPLVMACQELEAALARATVPEQRLSALMLWEDSARHLLGAVEVALQTD